MRPVWAVKAIIVAVFISTLIRCVCDANLTVGDDLVCGANLTVGSASGCDLVCGANLTVGSASGCDLVCGANLTVGSASGCDLNSNMQDWSSTTTFNVGDDLVYGANLTVGSASGCDLNSNMQDWSSTTTFNVGDDLVYGANLTVGSASGCDLNSNMQDWSSTTTFNVGDDLVYGANLTVGSASGCDLNSNMQDWSSTTTFNVGDDLLTALQDLHRTLNYPPVLQGWNGGNPCGESCSGVTCSAVSSITHFKIQGCNLTWYLGGLLHNLQYLEHLDVSPNIIVCKIPYGLPPNNTHINMACNYLRKNIPHLFATMKKLSHLDCRNLSHNFLHGPIGNVFIGLDNLKEMVLSHNNFAGDLPSSIGSLSNLSLLIGGNKFYPLGDSPLWAFSLEGVLLEHNTSPPPTTQENAKENFVPNKVIKNKNPMGRGGIGFMVGGGTLLIFLFVASHKLLRLRRFKSNRSSLVSHLVSSRRNKLKYRGPKIGTSQASSSSGNNPPNKYAVLIGMQYPRIREWTLDFCLDEIIDLKNILIKKFGFSIENITLLSDIRGYKKKTKYVFGLAVTIIDFGRIEFDRINFG